MGKHGKASCLNVEKKDSFFYHAVVAVFVVLHVESRRVHGGNCLVRILRRLRVLVIVTWFVDFCG